MERADHDKYEEKSRWTALICTDRERINMSTLLTLTDKYLELLLLAEDTEMDQEVFQDTLEAVIGEICEKADSYAAVMKRLKSDSKLYLDESKKFKAASDQMDNIIKKMKERAMYAMDAMGVTEIEGNFSKLRIEGNGGVRPLVITGPVPDSYKMITYSDNTEQIRKDLEAGKKLDFAHLAERGTHLAIR